MIKIDMEMPESCEKCVFLLNGVGYKVCFTENNMNNVGDISKKPDWCPLIEVKE